MELRGFFDQHQPWPARCILGVKVSTLSLRQVSLQIMQWARAAQSRRVCLANAHMLMLARDSPAFEGVVNGADLVTADGRPLAWILGSPQVCGRELTRHVCEAAALQQVPVGFYGGEPQVLKALTARLRQQYPGLVVGYAHSPPFRRLSAAEDQRIVEDILDSGIRILFVGLGCPKQERWMAEHAHRLPVTMLGIGGAFDMLSGAQPVVPVWLQAAGLEWMFRLALEPRRLLHRNVWYGSRFVVHTALEALRAWRIGEVR